jgi:sodium/hydrogen exchanger-like protein 6/7
MFSASVDQQMGELPRATESTETTSFVITFLVFLLLFFVIGAAFEKYKPKYGHETGVTVVLGMLFSLIFYVINGANLSLLEVYGFKSTFFFDVILPPLIFNSGFNMRRKKFFQNLGNIMIFGLGVTLVCFILYSAGSWAVLNYMNLMMT